MRSDFGFSNRVNGELEGVEYVQPTVLFYNAVEIPAIEENRRISTINNGYPRDVRKFLQIARGGFDVFVP